MGEDSWEFWLRGFGLELEEARRAIDGQRTAVENIRGRASWLLGAGATIAGLLVSLNDDLGVLTYLGLGALGVVGVLTLEVLRPRTFSFDMDPNVIRSWTALVESPAVMVDNLALKHWRRYLDNERILTQLHRVYVWSTGALVAEVCPDHRRCSDSLTDMFAAAPPPSEPPNLPDPAWPGTRNDPRSPGRPR